MKIQIKILIKELPILFIIVFSFIFGLTGTGYAPMTERPNISAPLTQDPQVAMKPLTPDNPSTPKDSGIPAFRKSSHTPPFRKGGPGGFSSPFSGRKILLAQASGSLTGLPQSSQNSTILRVQPSLKALDLTKIPTNEELMASGQLGGQLYPTHEIGDKERVEKINLSFGEAIQAWNEHRYEEATGLFEDHLEEYPDSPWASEAALHIGCDATYNGRYSEAEEAFKWIIKENEGDNYEGARRLLNKARLRLGTLKVYQNNFKEAMEHFTLLHKEGSDWRDRTYASHWIQRISRYSANKLSLLNCGAQALAHLMKSDGKEAEARKIMEELPKSEPGHSVAALLEMASKHGYPFTALRLTRSELKKLPLPAIMHIQGKNQGDSGHYWILEETSGEKLDLFDPQAGIHFNQTLGQFSKEWSGIALVFSDKKDLPGKKLAERDMEETCGGCCGVSAPESSLGNNCRYNIKGAGGGCPTGFGSPAWSVNMVNLNLYVHDTPLWYDSKIGPSVQISLSYNAQSAINQSEPFGNKWMLNYGSYLVVDTYGNVTIFMPDGRRDVYNRSGSTYTPPYQVFNTLTKIAENHYELKFKNNVVYVYNIPQGTPSQQPFLVEIRDPHGYTLTMGYDSNIHLTTITDALGRVTTLTYNANNLVTSVTDPFNRQATFDYDANRNLTSITDMGGYTSTLSYNSNAYLTGIQNGWGQWGFYIEPADGIMHDTGYPEPGTYMYGNYRITITNPVGDKEEFFYYAYTGAYSWYVAPRHYVPYTANPNNGSNLTSKTYFYLWHNATPPYQGEITKITDPEYRSVTFGYDSAGNRTSITDDNGSTTTFVYDTRGNITSTTDPKNNVTQFTYDTNNNLTTLIDAANRTYTYAYTGPDLTTITDPRTGTVNFTYNTYGQLLTLEDPRSKTTSFGYDTSHNLITVTNPINGIDSYTYDTIGRVSTHTDPKNNMTTYTRDGLGRVTQVTYQDQSTKAYSYDCCSLSSVTDSVGTITFAYDTLKRLSTLTDVYGKVVSYGYDKNNNLTTLTYPGGNVVTYSYDKADRLIKVTDWLNNITTYNYKHIPMTNVMKTTYPDGSVISHRYDIAGRLETILDVKADSTLNAMYKYGFDALGNRTTIASYQPQISIPTPPNTSYTHDDDNRMLTAGTTSFGYDDNGNLTGETGGSTATYTWNYNNMLTQVAKGGNTYNYVYDAHGNRVKKIVNGTETRYVVDPDGGLSKVLAETDSSGNITAYYVYGMGLISKITPSNQAYFYHFDGLGSTVAMTDSAGNVVNKYTYDEYGNLLSSQEATPNPFRYVGQFGVMDEANGLLFMRARYYDPDLGRFISKDPIGFGGGLNLYGYVKNNPINEDDPEGLQRTRGGRKYKPPKRTKPIGSDPSIYENIEILMEEQKRLFGEDADCVHSPGLGCEVLICNGEVVTKDRPVIVKDSRSCFCETTRMVYRGCR